MAESLGRKTEGQRSPGRMDILHERDLKAQEQAVSMCQKNSEWGGEAACLNKEIWLEIRKKKGGVYTLWKKGQEIRRTPRMHEVM